ncbi:uncharacterized protein LOC141532695 [Cotesia typhae]|uniref:uncharacterized protein LOC141532695 n=1 Tax=Cotesia typhae TaxID=2053667 RepID=UPI003D6851A3
MLPATSKSSRRSSILKIPKKSNSQNAESNSSEENSPTKQLKRRVSFAEKKSVKEFADSIEQGTVWDSTYEESDSSQIRMSHSEYTKSLVIQTSTNITYQSSQIQEATRISMMVQPEIEFKFPTESCTPRISHVDPEILANKENMPEILGLETVESSFVEVEDVPVQASGFAVYCDEENLNETNTEDVPMECTIVADALVPVSADAEERDRTQIFGNESIKFTEVVPSKAIRSGLGDEAPLVFDKSMEITEAVPRTNLLAIRSAVDGTEVFNNRSMELTEVVPRTNFRSAVDRTEVFNNRSMELTGAVPRTNLLAIRSAIDGTEVFNNRSMELTEAVPSLKAHFSNDRTQVFHNKSMELTEAVPRTNLHYKLLEDRTQVFQNRSMELTEAICPRTKLPYKVPEDKTEFFYNQSMEQTEAICPRTSLLSKVPGDKTEVFHNKSMELTEAIAPNLRPNNENDLKFLHESLKRSDALNIFSENNDKEEKTQFFLNNSMEMTGVVSLIPDQDTQQLKEKTQIFHNRSMEITQPIHPRGQDQDIAQNYFMENTVSINPSLKRSYKCIADPRTPRSVISSPNPKNPRDCPVDRKASMDMLHRILHQGFEDLPDVPDVPEPSKYTLEESMEMTVAIPSLTNRSEIPVPDLTEDVVPSFGSGEVVERHDNLEEISTLNPKESFVDFDDKIPGEDIGATSVFLEQTPSFMYNSDLDQDTDVKNYSVLDMEQQVLQRQDLEQKDLYQNLEQQDLAQKVLEQRDLEQSMEQQDLTQGLEQQDLEQGMEQGLEQQDLEQGMEQQENYDAIKYIKSKLEQSDIRSVSTGDLTGSSLKRSILDDEEEQINKKKFIYKQDMDKYEHQESMMEECSEVNVIEKVYLPEIGNVEKSEISLRLKKLIFRGEMVNRKLKASRLGEFKRLEKKTLELGTEKQSESKTRFDILKEGLEEYAKSRSCLWKIHTIHPEVICIEFRKTALVLAVKIEVRAEERISKICVIPRVNDADSEMLRMTDRLIVRAIDCDKMADDYLTYADVPKLIADVTEKVYFVYDFYDEMVKLCRINLMELDGDIVTVTVRTKKMETIIKLIINIEKYPAVTPEDIKIVPILGTVKEDVKKLIKNLKPSPKLLTLYITDVYEFLELLAFANSKN